MDDEEDTDIASDVYTEVCVCKRVLTVAVVVCMCESSLCVSSGP